MPRWYTYKLILWMPDKICGAGEAVQGRGFVPRSTCGDILSSLSSISFHSLLLFLSKSKVQNTPIMDRMQAFGKNFR